MKKRNLVLSVMTTCLVSCFLLSGCNGQKQIDSETVKTVKVEEQAHLQDDTVSPACKITIDYSYLAESDAADSIAQRINRTIQAHVLGKEYIRMNPEVAVDSFKNTYIDNYRKDVNEFYQEDIKNGTPKDELPTWYNYEYGLTTHFSEGKEGILNFIAETFEYTGGAHPNSWNKWMNFEKNTGKLLALKDVFMAGSEKPMSDKWLSVSDGFAYLKCDFGRWGAEKRMIKPLLEKAEDGRWYCRWQLTPSGKVWGTSHSSDLLKWAPQQYVNAEKPAVPRLVTARQIVLDKDTLNGYMQKVPYADIEQLIRFAEHKKFRDIQNNERTEQDAVRFAGLKPVTATIRVDAGRVKPISEHLIGIFFEDINYGADGGLYAELVQNRDFEYSAKDGARDKNWNSTYAWSIQGTDAELSVSEDNPIHTNTCCNEKKRHKERSCPNALQRVAVQRSHPQGCGTHGLCRNDRDSGKDYPPHAGRA